MTTEEEVVKHVQTFGRYHGHRVPFYSVQWNGISYISEEVRDLVVQICKAEGIPVREPSRGKAGE